MARNETLVIDGQDWAQLTNADVSAASFQNQGPGNLLVVATTLASEPTDTSGAILYKPGEGEKNSLLADLFPGVSSGDRLYGYAETAICRVFVSHP